MACDPWAFLGATFDVSKHASSGGNLYRYVGNNPLANTDPRGTDLASCAVEAAQAFSDMQGQPDYYAHCYVGCKIMAYCGPEYCAGAAVLKELWDLMGYGTPELRDIANTLVGCGCGAVPILPCSTCCKCVPLL